MRVNTHYSNVSFRVVSIISTGLSALVFTGTSFPREEMIAIMLGSISVPVLPILFKTRCASKKHSKRKLQILNADFSP